MTKGFKAMCVIALNAQLNGINLGNELRAIEKELKALEIIKKKQIAVDEFIRCVSEYDDELALEEYSAFAGEKYTPTQEEFYLLKEVLMEVVKNDKE